MSITHQQPNSGAASERRLGRHCCNRRVSWPPSLSLGLGDSAAHQRD